MRKGQPGPRRPAGGRPGPERAFLPATGEEMRARGWDAVDVLIVSGDAYVDHPSFGAAVIGRTLEREGYRVGIAAQPRWLADADVRAFGRPRLFAGITAGCLDSLLARYTAHLTPRRSDAYSPGGRTGLRPDRASIVYANLVRRAFPGLPILLGGIEASLRRLAHYDYWSDSIRRPVLLDARADWVAYGAAERQVVEIARRLAAGETPAAVGDVRGTVRIAVDRSAVPPDAVFIPSVEAVMEDDAAFEEAFRIWYRQRNAARPLPVVQPAANRWVVEMPPAAPFSTAEMDRACDLPFTRRAHPLYDRAGGVPALRTVEFSVIGHRGCAGGCAFCTLFAHQGKTVQSRSPSGIREEVARMARSPSFRGTVTDIGGPTANMYGAVCRAPGGPCDRPSCVFPAVCPDLDLHGGRHLKALGEAAALPRVKHVFVETGVRHDLVLADRCGEYLPVLCARHVGGHLKVAPEHSVDGVLAVMRKPAHETFERFRALFDRAVRKAGKPMFLVPYFMSGHPGCAVEDMIALAEYSRGLGCFTEQVQEFVPLPMTLSGCMYRIGRDPLTGRAVHVARGAERTIQRALLQPSDRRHRGKLAPLLKARGKSHLLVPPARGGAAAGDEGPPGVSDC